MVLCSATSAFRSEWQTYVGSVRVRWRGAMELAQSVRIQTPCIDLNWMLLECIRKSRTIRKSWTHRTWNRNRARQEPQWELQKEQTLESNCCDPQQTNWPHPQTNCAQSAQQSDCSPAPLHSAGYLLVMLVYKYRNNHLKILLKLFYNLRLFDARHPAMQFCSLRWGSVLFVVAWGLAWPAFAFLSARSMCKFHCKATLFSLSFERNFPSAITSDSENADSVSNSSSSSSFSSSLARTPYRVIQGMLTRRHVFLLAAQREMRFCLELSVWALICR